MNVFISWSGQTSKNIAKILNEYLKRHVKPYVSFEGIASGESWFNNITLNLKKSSVGILCLTKDNLNAPWLLFEAGAIWKEVELSLTNIEESESPLNSKRNEVNTRIIPLVIDFSKEDIPGKHPLAHFQAKDLGKNDILEIVKTLNNLQPEKDRKDNTTLEDAFDEAWGNLDAKLQEVLKPKIDKCNRSTLKTEHSEYGQKIANFIKGKRILVAEFNDKVREKIRDTLSPYEIDIIEGSTLSSMIGLKNLDSSKYHLAIIGYNLPLNEESVAQIYGIHLANILKGIRSGISIIGLADNKDIINCKEKEYTDVFSNTIVKQDLFDEDKQDFLLKEIFKHLV